MAAVALPLEETAGKPTRTQYVQACVNNYFEWRDAGLCPAEIADDYDALIYWDKEFNGSSLLDYDRERNYRSGLRRQAMEILLNYTRQAVRVPGTRRTFRVAGVSRLPRRARKQKRFSLHRVSRMKASDVELVIESMKNAIRSKVVRARELGANRKAIQAALRAAEEEANAAYEEAQV